VLDNADLTEAEHPELSTPATPAARRQSVQNALRFLGYDPGPEDGKEGPKLRAAVAAYRRDKKLPAGMSEDDVWDIILLEATRRSMEQLHQEVEKMAPKP
jgi:peptidoglycan hydrolase-like protein with peptidoglycan-binding domain